MPKVEEVLGFAYEFYRAPLRYKAKLNKALPDEGVLRELLEVIRGRGPSPPLRRYAETLATTQDGLHRAVLFLLKQWLFKEENTHYQVLGLSPQASAEVVRRHYRLLITLFHPDRAKFDETWTRSYVVRLNEAYITLKNPQKRDCYDRDLASGKVGAKVREKGASRRQGKLVPNGVDPALWDKGRLTDRLYRFPLWQRHPKWVVVIGLSVVVIPLLVVVWPEAEVDSFRRTEGAAQTETVSQGEIPKGENPSDFHLYRPHSPLKIAEQERSPLTQPQPGNEPQVMDNIDLGQLGPPVVVAPEAPPPKVGSPSEPDTGSSVAPAQGAALAPTVVAGSDSKQGRSPSGKVPRGSSVAGGNTPMNGIPPHEEVLARFILAYETGDLDRLLSLFAKDVVTNEGIGIDWVRREYGRQFEVSERRRLRISGVRLLSSANVWIDMKMQFEIDLWDRAGGARQGLAGEAIMGLLKSGDRYLIKEHKSYVEKR